MVTNTIKVSQKMKKSQSNIEKNIIEHKILKICYKHLNQYLKYQFFEESIKNLGLIIGFFKQTCFVIFLGRCKKFQLGWLFLRKYKKVWWPRLGFLGQYKKFLVKNLGFGVLGFFQRDLGGRFSRRNIRNLGCIKGRKKFGQVKNLGGSGFRVQVTPFITTSQN